MFGSGLVGRLFDAAALAALARVDGADVRVRPRAQRVGACALTCAGVRVGVQLGVAARAALISAASMTGEALGGPVDRARAATALLCGVAAAMGSLAIDHRVSPGGANAAAGIAELWLRVVVNFGAETLALECSAAFLTSARAFSVHLAARAKAAAASAAAAAAAGGGGAGDNDVVAECECEHAACFEALGPVLDAWVLVRRYPRGCWALPR